MTSLTSTKIKRVIKTLFPFVSYRRKVVNFFYFKYWEIYAGVNLSQELLLVKNCKLVIEEVSELNKEGLIKFSAKYYDHNMYKNCTSYLLKNKYRGFIALFEGNIIGYTWWWSYNHGVNPPPEMLFYNVKLEKDEVYGFYSFIAPQYRGHGNAIEFLSRVYQEYKKLGYNRATGIHGAASLPVKWTYRCLGLKDIRTFPVYAFFNQRIAYTQKAIFLRNSPRHPYYPFEYCVLFSLRWLNSMRLRKG